MIGLGGCLSRNPSFLLRRRDSGVYPFPSFLRPRSTKFRFLLSIVLREPLNKSVTWVFIPNQQPRSTKFRILLSKVLREPLNKSVTWVFIPTRRSSFLSEVATSVHKV